MADPHELPYSSTQIEQGLSRAISPDSTPTAASSNLASSGGIKSALDTKADGSTVTALDGRVTTLEGVSPIPTAWLGGLTTTYTDGATLTNYTLSGSTLSGASVSTSQGRITLTEAGTYLVHYIGYYTGSSSNGYWRVRFREDNNTLTEINVGLNTDTFYYRFYRETFSHIATLTSGSRYFDINVNDQGYSGTLTVKNVGILVQRIS